MRASRGSHASSTAGVLPAARVAGDATLGGARGPGRPHTRAGGAQLDDHGIAITEAERRPQPDRRDDLHDPRVRAVPGGPIRRNYCFERA